MSEERKPSMPPMPPTRHDDGTALHALDGEPGIPHIADKTRTPWSKKGLFAIVLLTGSLVAVSALSIQRFAATGKKTDEDAKLTRDRPAAATTEPRKLDMAMVAQAKAAPPLIPAIEPAVEPIGVHRTAPGATAAGGNAPLSPEDAPVVLVSTRPAAAPAPTRKAPADSRSEGASDASTAPGDTMDETRRNLESYQRQLRGLMDTLTQSAVAATGQDVPGAPTTGSPLGLALPGAALAPSATPAAASTSGLFGGQLQGSATPRVTASTLGQRSLILPKGTAFTCALKTRVISAASGLVACQVQRNVYSDDGRVLLIERGSHMDGEYRIASLRPGTVRIPVLWTRIRTPHGVTVNVDSPGTGQLGESGIDGHVDNRWGERIGAALLLSLIDDSVKLVISNQTDRVDNNSTNTIVLPSTTANASKLAEKVLDSTINIPPLIYQNQGGIVGIVVARDVDFSSVYELQPTALEGGR